MHRECAAHDHDSALDNIPATITAPVSMI